MAARVMEKRIFFLMVFSFFCIGVYSNEKDSNVTASSLILSNGSKSVSYHDSINGERLSKTDILSIISQCPENEPYLAKRKRDSITSWVLSSSGLVMGISGLVFSSDLFEQTNSNLVRQNTLLSVGTACVIFGTIAAVSERSLYVQAIGNYNLWIMGIPLKVGSQ